MVSYPLSSAARKYRNWLIIISKLTFVVTIIAFFIGLGLMLLLAMPLPFQLHDQSAPPADEIKASLENNLRILPLVEIGLLSPLIAIAGVRYVNDRTNRGIYLSFAALATLMPFAIFVLINNDSSWAENAVGALSIFGSIIGFAIIILIKERQTLNRPNSSPP